jgi:hypothetical protein
MIPLLKKMNRGIILSVVLLLAVVVYLVALAAVQSAEKPLIEQVCREYVSLETQYTMLPPDYRSDDAVMTDQELDSYLSEIENKIAPYYIDNDRIRQLALERLANRITSQSEGWDRLLSYEKEITEFDSFSFSGSEATVKIKTRSVIERPENSAGKIEGGRLAGETTDTVVLQKSDGKWLVVYAQLNEPMPVYR